MRLTNRRLLTEALEAEANMSPEEEVAAINHELNNIEEISMELEKEEDAVEGAIEVIELAEDDMAKLDLIETQLDEGQTVKMSESEFKSNVLVTESIMGRYGNGFRTLATESFGGDETKNRAIVKERVEQSRLVTENFITATAGLLTDHLRDVGSSSKLLVRRLRKASEKANRLMEKKGKYITVKNDIIDGHELGNSHWARKLTLDDKFMGYDLSALGGHVAKNLALKVNNEVNQDVIEELKAAAKDGKLNVELSHGDMKKILPKTFKFIESCSEDLKSLGIKENGKAPAFGNEYWLNSNSKEVSGRSAGRNAVGTMFWIVFLTWVGIPIAIYRTNKRFKENAPVIDIIPVDKMGDYAKFLEKMADDIEKSPYGKFLERYSNDKAISNQTKTVMKEIDKLEATKGSKKQIKAIIRGQASLVRDVMRVRNRNINLIATGLVGYVKVSLSNYRFKG